ncbi:MAG: DMT family transporter [Coprobacillus sp.]
MDKNKGHIFALITILVWGTTFISTKILLVDFQPIEILFFRFVIGFFVLFLICPRFLKKTTLKQEMTFMAAGLSGVCLYYLMENIALTYTSASNVGVIISIAPFFTAMISTFIMREKEKLSFHFFVGFVVSMIGICIISFQSSSLQLNPLGDFLAILAALLWACYATLTKTISTYGYSTILTTRRTFFYGILFMIPTLFIFDFRYDITRLMNPVYLLNILFLGICASALCFVTWNYAVKILGAIQTSIYIYMVPVITVITSALVLGESIDFISGIGILLTLIGLCLSENIFFKRKIIK